MLRLGDRPSAHRAEALLVTFDYPPAHGGIQHYAVRLARELAAIGYPTCVLAPQARNAAAIDAAGSATVRRFFERGGPVRVVAESIELARAARATTQPHTIALSWLPGLGAALLPRRLRGPLTVLAHGTELDVRPGSARERAMRFVFARADRVVVNSAAVAHRVRELGLATDPATVYPGVDPIAIERRPAGVPTVVFVGRLVARKGVDRLIDAIALLRRRDIVLHVVGDGPERNALITRANDRGIAERVRFSGAVGDEERNAALGQAWCFAMPSRREGGDIEGFGIVYLEAAMAGLPTVGGRNCGAEDAIADGVTGLLVDGTDAHAIASAIASLIDDRARAEAMGAAGRARALNAFSWSDNARAIARLAGLERSA
jgi:phosphatidylinositol alpha-1,6-mannosyltransferase